MRANIDRYHMARSVILHLYNSSMAQVYKYIKNIEQMPPLLIWKHHFGTSNKASYKVLFKDEIMALL